MPAELFKAGIAATVYEDIDLGDAGLRLWPAAFGSDASRQLFQSLLDSVPWCQPSLQIAGQRRLIPRLQCWMGDENALYAYSGMQLRPVPWSPVVWQIKTTVEALVRQCFNSVLLNCYRDGNDSVSWHADAEPELGSQPAIASVSLGAARVFELKHKYHKARSKCRILLPNGSLLLMKKGMQNNWLHQLPKVKHLYEPRINLTFRAIPPKASEWGHRNPAGQ